MKTDRDAWAGYCREGGAYVDEVMEKPPRQVRGPLAPSIRALTT